MSSTPASSTSAASTSRRPVKPEGVSVAGASSSAQTPTRACRVDIPVSEWAKGGRERLEDSEEGGDLKYRKRKGPSSLWRIGRWVGALSLVCGIGVIALRVMAG